MTSFVQNIDPSRTKEYYQINIHLWHSYKYQISNAQDMIDIKMIDGIFGTHNLSRCWDIDYQI